MFIILEIIFERYYFRVEGNRRGEIEPMQGEIEMNIGKLKFVYGKLRGSGIRIQPRGSTPIQVTEGYPV